MGLPGAHGGQGALAGPFSKNAKISLNEFRYQRQNSIVGGNWSWYDSHIHDAATRQLITSVLFCTTME
jgi:hypothetical protein